VRRGTGELPRRPACHGRPLGRVVALRLVGPQQPAVCAAPAAAAAAAAREQSRVELLLDHPPRQHHAAPRRRRRRRSRRAGGGGVVEADGVGVEEHEAVPGDHVEVARAARVREGGGGRGVRGGEADGSLEQGQGLPVEERVGDIPANV
jgi:hypothetical protein